MYDLVKRKIGENIHNIQTIDELFHFNTLPKKRNKIEQCNIFFIYTQPALQDSKAEKC